MREAGVQAWMSPSLNDEPLKYETTGTVRSRIFFQIDDMPFENSQIVRRKTK